MSAKQIGGMAVLALMALCVFAWIDGGYEPIHPIEQTIELPESGQ